MTGHRRPVGTTTGRLRFDWHNGDRSPELGDVTVEAETSRWYLVVGVEEHRDSPRVWWIVLERLPVEEGERLRDAATPFWEHTRYRSRPKSR